MSKGVVGGLGIALLVSGCGSSDGATPGTSQSTELAVTLVATYDAYPHTDGFSGQTAKGVTAGIRSLKLTDANGGAWVLLDAAPGNVSVSYTSSSPTVLATIAPANVRAGHYTKARLVQDWSRFDVSATRHETGLDASGTLHVLQATSEGAMVDGKTLEQGQYEHSFASSGVTRSYDGTSPIPDHSTTAEAEAFDESGEWAVYFPLDLLVPAAATGTLKIEVNLDQAFRWSDVPGGANAGGVYDIAPPLYEPVEQFGGNRFGVSLE